MAQITYNDKTQLLPYNDKKFNAADANQIKAVVNQKADLSQIIDGNQSLGAWNPATNTPALTTTPAAVGKFYTVSAVGTSSVTGTAVNYLIGDRIISNGTAWQYVRLTLGDSFVEKTNLIERTDIVYTTGMLALGATSGVLTTTSTNNIYSGFIPVVAGQKYRYSGAASGTGVVTGYDQDQNFLNNLPASGGTVKIGTLVSTSSVATDFVIPTGCFWIRTSTNTASGNASLHIYQIGEVVRTNEIDYSATGVGNIPSVAKVKKLNDAVFGLTDITGVITTGQSNVNAITGVDTATTAIFTKTGMIPVVAGDKLYVTMKGSVLIGFDANQVYLSERRDPALPRRVGGLIILPEDIKGYPYPTGNVYNSTQSVYNFEYTIPTGVFFIRASSVVDVPIQILRENKVVLTNDRATYSEAVSGLSATKYISPLVLKQYLTLNSGGGGGTSNGSKSTYGAKGNAVLLLNCAVTAGSANLSAIGSAFGAEDVGKVIAIPYAGADNGTYAIGQTHVATITAVNSTTTVTMSAPVVKTIVNTRTITDGSMIANSNVLTSASANFIQGDVGKKITVPDAGELQSVARPRTHVVYISTVISSTQVTVTKPALQAVTGQTIIIPGAWVQYGSDDTVALQNAINTSATKKDNLLLENGRYLITSALVPTDNTVIKGQSRTGAIISPVGSNYAAFRLAANPLAPVKDNVYESFEVDGMGVTVNTYGAGNKAFHITHMLRPIFRDLYVHDTSATGIGCDFLIDYIMTNNEVNHCGRQVFEFGSGGGGSGIGIGTGAYLNESGVVSGNSVNECGKQGIFVESQSSNVLSRGVKIVNNSCNWNQNAGIGDRATDGTITEGNSCMYNGTGIELDVGFTPGLYSTNAKIANNYLVGNFGHAVKASYSGGNLSIIDNEVNGELRGTGQGIRVVLVNVGSTPPSTLNISGNNVLKTANLGINIDGTGQQNIVKVFGNTVVDTGTNTQSGIAAIRIAISTSRLYVKENICTDTRAVGSKTQGTGLQIVSGVTITKLVMDGNDFTDNRDAETNFTGASIGTTIAHFNP
jgi:hypothetical protein